MDNVYRDPTYADTVERLKSRLLRTKQKVGDTDEAYPALIERREAH